jgi:hypothetical protein
MADLGPIASVAPRLKRCNGRFGDLIDEPISSKAMAAMPRSGNNGRPEGLNNRTGADPTDQERTIIEPLFEEKRTRGAARSRL